MLTILKGSATAEIRLTVAGAPEGASVRAEYQNAVREFADAQEVCAWAFTAEETGRMALGAYPLRAWLTLADGARVELASVRVRVTDDPAEASASPEVSLATVTADGSGGAADVSTVFKGVEFDPDGTDTELREAVAAILKVGGGTVKEAE